MTDSKALLNFDPLRFQEQHDFVAARTTILYEPAGGAWAVISDDLAARFASQGIIVQFFPEDDLLSLPAVVFDPLAAQVQLPNGLTAPAPAGDSSVYTLVQFIAPIENDWLAQVEELGGIYVQNNPYNAAIFRLTTDQADQVRALPVVRWVGIFHPAYAVSYVLAGRQEPFGAVDLASLALDPAALAPEETGTLEVSFFGDVVCADQRSSVDALGVQVLFDTGYHFVVNASADQALALARLEGVCAVERHFPAALGNQRAGLITQVNQVRDFRNTNFVTNLDGSGEIVGVIDIGFDGGVGNPFHPDLAGRMNLLSLHVAAAGLNAANTQDLFVVVVGGVPQNIIHGTHVSGTIAGNGANTAAFGAGGAPANASNVRGVAPNAQIVMHSALNPALGIVDFRPFLGGFFGAHNLGARIHSNSWGRIGLPNNQALPTNNNYNNAISLVIDRFAYVNPEDLIVFLTHNQERDADNDGIMDQNHLPFESVAKNILAVGACENETNLEGLPNTWNATFPGRFAAVAGSGAPPVAGNFPISDSANDLAMFSDRGRVNVPGAAAARRRVRPDLVAPGTNILSTGPTAVLPLAAGSPGRPNTAPAAFYYLDSGTSMATPHVAGAAALTRQFYRQVYAQLRRPVLVEQITGFVNRPSTAPHAVGSVIAWVRPAGGGNDIAAARYSRTLDIQGAAVVLQSNAGPSPVPLVVRHGVNTLLLHRAADNTLRLSCYDPNLAIINAFGTNGIVTLAPASRPEDDRRPCMFIHQDEVAVAWVQNGGTTLLFQRFNALTGAKIDANPILLGDASSTSEFPYITHNGSEYALVWIHQQGGEFRLLFRRVAANGSLPDAIPVVVHHQVQALAEPHIRWNSSPLTNFFVLVWVDSRTQPSGSLFSHLLMSNGADFFLPSEIITLPAGSQLRRPSLLRRNDQGFVLMWEDNTQPGTGGGGRFDVYLGFLNEIGLVDPTIPIRGPNLPGMRISDTPNDTAGYTCLVDGQAITPVWYSNDEINSDLLGVYSMVVSNAGAFGAQVDPNTPLIQNGRYVNHQLHEHDALDLNRTAITWAGGDYFLVRVEPFGPGSQLKLVRTNSDGLPDAAFGPEGARTIDSDFGFDHLVMYWAPGMLLVADTFTIFNTLLRFDDAGNPVNTFGDQGRVVITEITSAPVSLGVGHRGTGANLRIIYAWGTPNVPNHILRYTVLNGSGAPVVAARNLGVTAGIRAEGTSAHGWFHFVESDAPAHSIAAWHITDPAAGTLAVFMNRFDILGNRQHAADVRLTAMVGDSFNAVIAPRPVVFQPVVPVSAADALNCRRREYGVVWQFRPNNAAPWELRFTSLDRQGVVQGPNDVQVISGANHATDPQLVWGRESYGLVWLEQAPAGGNHTLFFAVLDVSGNLVDLRLAGAAAALPAARHQVSATSVDVKDFNLTWNGRCFHITWTEAQDGKLRHMQAALTAPSLQGQPDTYSLPFSHASSALVRATLINGATNFRGTNLPNVGPNPNDGYGWGRLNVRQALAPLPPVTYYVRDDGAVAQGGTVRYRFHVPAGTLLLRLTLCWTDPPRVTLVNVLNLRMTAPNGNVYVGNRWGAAGTPAAPFSDPLPNPAPAAPFETTHNTQQIVLSTAANIPAGDYIVEVIGGSVPVSDFQQHPGQHFALVFVGSGAESVYGGPPGGPLPVY